MELVLQREPTVNEITFGILYMNGHFNCHTLEDAIRDQKIHGKTAIPEGLYKIEITWSPKFKRKLPLLIDVPNYEGVRIHPGNFISDTEGCILPGKDRVNGSVVSSRVAFDALLKQIEAAIARTEPVWINVINPRKASL